MRTGNHARKDFYQPGALIHRDTATLAAAGKTIDCNTLDAWTTITDGAGVDLTLAYTPPVDAVCVATMKMAAWHSVALTAVQFRIQETLLTNSIATWKVDHAATVEVYEWSMFPQELTADTAYTFNGQYYVSATTLTVGYNDIYTYLSLMVWRKP